MSAAPIARVSVRDKRLTASVAQCFDWLETPLVVKTRIDSFKNSHRACVGMLNYYAFHTNSLDQRPEDIFFMLATNLRSSILSCAQATNSDLRYFFKVLWKKKKKIFMLLTHIRWNISWESILVGKPTYRRSQIAFARFTHYFESKYEPIPGTSFQTFTWDTLSSAIGKLEPIIGCLRDNFQPRSKSYSACTVFLSFYLATACRI